MKRRLTAILIAFVILLCAVLPVGAAQNRYDPDAALAYAADHWCDGRGMCAEFVSNCLNAGGCSCNSMLCSDLLAQLRATGLCTEYTLPVNADDSVTVPSDYTLTAGDVVFYFCTAQGEYQHVVLCNGSDSDGYMKAYSHNNARNGKSKYFYSPRCPECGCRSIDYVTVMHFTVNNAPAIPALSPMKAVYSEEEQIIFAWGATEHTTQYDLLIEKQQEDGSFSAFTECSDAQSGCALTLACGTYRVSVRSVNADAHVRKGEDLRSAVSAPILFSVIVVPEYCKPAEISGNHEVS